MSSLYTKIKKNFVKAFVRNVTPRVGRKESSMNMLRLFASFGGTRSRAYGAGLVAMLAALFLAACGGGGGGTTPPVAKDAVVSVDSTTPAQGANDVLIGTKPTVNFTVSVGTYSTSTDVLTCGGSDVPGTSVVSGGVLTFTPTNPLPYDLSCVFTGTVTATGENGGKSVTKPWNVTFTTEAAPVLHYGERVYAGTGALPIRIIQKGDGTFDVERTANLTGYTEGVYPLTHCAYYIDKNFFANGRKLWNCIDVNNVLHNLSLDPAGNALHAYNGPAPARTLPVDPNWVEQQEGTPLGTSAYTAPSYGELFTRNTDSGVLLFEDLTGAVTTILSGDQLKLEEAISFLVTYSNP